MLLELQIFDDIGRRECRHADAGEVDGVSLVRKQFVPGDANHLYADAQYAVIFDVRNDQRAGTAETYPSGESFGLLKKPYAQAIRKRRLNLERRLYQAVCFGITRALGDPASVMPKQEGRHLLGHTPRNLFLLGQFHFLRESEAEILAADPNKELNQTDEHRTEGAIECVSHTNEAACKPNEALQDFASALRKSETPCRGQVRRGACWRVVEGRKVPSDRRGKVLKRLPARNEEVTTAFYRYELR